MSPPAQSASPLQIQCGTAIPRYETVSALHRHDVPTDVR